MAQLNETFMSAIAYRTLKDIENSSITQSEFCRLLGIQPSYVSLLKNKETWFKVPEWVWYLFRDFNNKKFEVNEWGQLDGHGYTIKEIKKDCKTKAKKENIDKAEKANESRVENKNGKDTTEIDLTGFPDMEVKIMKEGISHKDIINILRDIVDLELKQTYYLRDQWVGIKALIQKLEEK